MRFLSLGSFDLFYQIGNGCIPTIYTAEIFPQTSRAIVLSFLSSLDFVANVVVLQSYAPARVRLPC